MFSNFERTPYRLPFYTKDLPEDGEGYLAVFDADGTLWLGDVADDFTQFAISIGIISDKLWDSYKDIYEDDRQKGCEFLLTLYSGLRLDLLKEAAERWWVNYSKRRWISLVLESVYYFHKRKFLVAIVSGTPTFMLEPLETHLPIAKALGMDAEIDDNGCLTGNYRGISCYGKGKVSSIISCFGNTPIAFAAGNEINDIPMMDSSLCVALSVYPEKEFLKESIRRNYVILPRPYSFLRKKTDVGDC